MNKEKIFNIIKENMVELLFDLDMDSVKITDSLRDLGANSIDRVDIIMMSTEALNIKCEMMEFKDAKNIEDIVDILASKLGVHEDGKV